MIQLKPKKRGALSRATVGERSWTSLYRALEAVLNDFGFIQWGALKNFKQVLDILRQGLRTPAPVTVLGAWRAQWGGGGGRAESEV